MCEERKRKQVRKLSFPDLLDSISNANSTNPKSKLLKAVFIATITVD